MSSLKRKIKKLFKRDVNEFIVQIILKEFISLVSSKMYVIYKITNRGTVKVYTNLPGILIGRSGQNFNEIKHRLITEANAKNFKVYEVRNEVHNFYD